MQQLINIFWFRRDLRLQDNHGLFQALTSGLPVLPVFIFDKEILDKLDRNDRRVPFIHQQICELQNLLTTQGNSFHCFYTSPSDAFKKLTEQYSVHTVFTNDDYEPYAILRDNSIEKYLLSKNIAFKKFKDHVVFEKSEVMKDNQEPYTVFTPYSRKWKATLTQNKINAYPSENKTEHFYKIHPIPIPSLQFMGFSSPDVTYPAIQFEKNIITNYGEQRNFPGINGTSKQGIHLRFGTVSTRQLVINAMEFSDTYLNELIWREFYQMILFHFPKVVGHAFKPAYDNIPWRNNESEFQRWCIGETGYPIVDAGMRELNNTGFMHNRVRMINASFLCKHLLIDWRWGEAYFANTLLDFELASNNGGWQWSAGSGCDSAPYFRVFNPYIQTKKFDPDFAYIKKWVPEFEEFTYPKPIVDHEFARKRCLEVYASALKNN